jgi:DNA-binding transcriptional MerR regulator
MPTLTISQLAAHVGVTVRAVRHYHQCGLLEEPERDASGYRRYGGQAVVDLIRIKTLSDAGVPLARIQELLGAGPEEFATAVSDIDAALQQKIRELTRSRRRIAELAGGERLFLPAEVAAIVDQLRGMGLSEPMVKVERDAWIVVAALSPEQVPRWAEEKLAALADPEFRRLYLATDEARGWDPDDPRIAKLAGDMAAWLARFGRRDQFPEDVAVDPAVLTLMSEHVAAAMPVWRRLADLAAEQLRDDDLGSAKISRAAGPSRSRPRTPRSPAGTG